MPNLGLEDFPIAFPAGFAILLPSTPGPLHLQHPQNLAGAWRASAGRRGGCGGVIRAGAQGLGYGEGKSERRGCPETPTSGDGPVPPA